MPVCDGAQTRVHTRDSNSEILTSPTSTRSRDEDIEKQSCAFQDSAIDLVNRANDSSAKAPEFDTLCRTLEQCPNGYPRVAAFLSSDRNFSIYRSYSYLRSRLLLVHQQQLQGLENELDALDRLQDAREQPRLQSWEIDKAKTESKGETRSRYHIFGEIKKTLADYDELLLRSKDMEAMPHPSRRDYRSVRRFFSNEVPLVKEEMTYLKWEEDLITLRNGRECAGFDGLVEAILQRVNYQLEKINCRLVKNLFTTPELRRKTKNENIHYFSPSRVEIFVNLLITAVIFVLLVIPVVVMYKLTAFDTDTHRSTFRAIGVLIIFTLIFGAAMSLLTRAKRHELFAASAAYCAVLVVFISNFTGSGGDT